MHILESILKECVCEEVVITYEECGENSMSRQEGEQTLRALMICLIIKLTERQVFLDPNKIKIE